MVESKGKPLCCAGFVLIFQACSLIIKRAAHAWQFWLKPAKSTPAERFLSDFNVIFGCAGPGTMEDISNQLAAILTGLGDSANQVAETLKGHGIQGARNAVGHLNPIVRLVQGSLLISCLGMDVMVPNTMRVTLLDGKVVETALPQAVRDFLSAFNGGAYPELEMPVSKDCQ